MLERLDDYDWGEAFGFGTPQRCEGDNDVSIDNFTREDVERIIAIEDGDNDGPSWIGFFQLKDSRFAFISAWCDYTGWD